MPGSSLPSRNSRLAPPPVETCVNLSASLSSSTAATESPPPTTTVAPSSARWRQVARHGARAVAEGGHLEHAQGSVPDDGPGGLQGASKATTLCGPDVDRRPAVGDLVRRHDLVLGAAGHLLGDHDVGRQQDRDALGLGRLQDALRVLDAVALQQALAHRVALGHQERVGHAAADDERVDAVHQVFQDGHLAADLGATDDRREGRAGDSRRPERLAISFSISRPA